MARKTLRTQLDELAAVNVQLHTDLMLAEQERDTLRKSGENLASAYRPDQTRRKATTP